MGGESKIIHIPIPKMSDLAYYIGLIDPNEKRDQSAPTEFQWQILKTRFVYIFLIMFMRFCNSIYVLADFLFGKTKMY